MVPRDVVGGSHGRGYLFTLVALWYLTSGLADSLLTVVVRDTGFVAGPCAVLFGVSWAAATVVVRDSTLPRPTWTAVKTGAANALGVLLMYTSVRRGSLARTYAVKATEPLTIAVLAMWMGERVSWRQAGAIAVICVGSTLLGAHDRSPLALLTSDPLPVALALGSNVCLSLRTVLAKTLLVPRAAVNRALVPVAVFRETSFASVVLLIPLHAAEVGWWGVAVEGGGSAAFHRYVTSIPGVVVAATCYFFYNAIGFTILEALSSSSYAVAKEVRCIFVYLWMALWFRQPLARVGWIGVAVVAAGAVLYGTTVEAPSKRPFLPMHRGGVHGYGQHLRV